MAGQQVFILANALRPSLQNMPHQSNSFYEFSYSAPRVTLAQWWNLAMVGVPAP